MHRTPLNKPPLASPHSSAYSASNPLYSPGPKNPPMFQLWTTGSERAREFGTQLISISNRQCGDIKPLQMPAGPTPPSIAQEIRFGSRPGICISACPVRSWVPAILVTFHLQLPAPYRIHPVFHVSLLKPFSPSAPDPNERAVPPPPEVLAEPTIYWVRNIMDSRRRGGHLEYFIDWEGYGPEERSWVARDDVLDPSHLADFHQNHPDHPAPRGRGRPRHRPRVSGAAPGGGGTVRESLSPSTMLTRSQSPEY